MEERIRKSASDYTPIQEQELHAISGGVLRSVLGGLIVHVALEAYNDWETHKATFNEGRAAVR